MKDSTFITRVIIKNYKSIAACDVQLCPLTFLVGPNGAGKSNFLDALRFVADALNSSLDHAIRDRGGINDVRRRSGGHPNHFGIRLDFALPDGSRGHYAFRIGATSLLKRAYEVQREECVVRNAEILTPETYFHVHDGAVTQTSLEVAPAAAIDRLFLVNASGLKEFRPVYEAFSRMGFYSLNTDKIRDIQAPDPGDLLTWDGSNLASVLGQLSPAAKERIEEYLAAVVSGVHGVEVKEIGPKETLEFRQGVAGAKHPWRFLANNMSDGTLRVLGILVAVFQGDERTQNACTLWGLRNLRLRCTRRPQGCCWMDFAKPPRRHRFSSLAIAQTCLMTKILPWRRFSRLKRETAIRQSSLWLKPESLQCEIDCIQQANSYAWINCDLTQWQLKPQTRSNSICSS